MRNPLVIGNWKLNGNKNMVIKIITELRENLDSTIGCDVTIAPPSIYLTLAKHHLDNSKIALGAQNVDTHLSGAFTGEISALMLKDVGVKHVIIGHYERRIYHKENDQVVAQKFALLKEVGLIPVLCIGENKKESDFGRTEAVCISQINNILNSFGITAFENTVIAYEPMWAVGTGKSANQFYAQKVHKFIRDYIAKYDKKIAEQILIQYGGSVDSSNASDFFMQPDIDGVLVGSSALKPNDFSAIVKIIAKSIKG